MLCKYREKEIQSLQLSAELVLFKAVRTQSAQFWTFARVVWLLSTANNCGTPKHKKSGQGFESNDVAKIPGETMV